MATNAAAKTRAVVSGLRWRSRQYEAWGLVAMLGAGKLLFHYFRSLYHSSPD